MNLPAPHTPQGRLPGPVNEPPPFQPLTFQVSDEQKLELLEYWRSIKQRKWAILGLGLAAAVVAGALSFAITPVYESTATLQIEPTRGKLVGIEDIYAAAAGGPQAREAYQTQVEILKSREVAERTVRALRLWEHPEYNPKLAAEGWVPQLKNMLGMGRPVPATEDELAAATTVTLMEKHLSIEPVRLSLLAKVNVESKDPALAAKIANTLASEYILNDREARFQVSQQASQFLQERLGDLRSKLTESEQALQAYRQSRGIVNLGGSAQTLAGQQAGGTNEQLVAARARRIQLESAQQQVAAAPAGDYSGVPWVARDPSVIQAQGKVNELNQRLAQLSETLGGASTQVIQVKAELENAQLVLRTQQAAVAEGVLREYQAARVTEQSIERALSAARSGVADLNKEEFQLAVLEREVQTNRELYDMFMSRAKETNLAGDVQAAIARVVDAAIVETIPIKPRKAQLVVVALVLALLLGAVVSVVIDRLDNTLKGGNDAEVRLQLPMLAVLPALQKHDNVQMARLFIDEPNSQHAEAVRTARTGVLLSNIDRSHKSILVTSTIPGEGKTTVAINLALAHAQTKRTLLIDADMRRPQVGRRLNLAQGSKGLANLVSGEVALSECLHGIVDSQLIILPVGDLPPNPLELLLSERFRNELKSLESMFEIVIIDSPPVELVSEALVLAPLVTSTVLVAKAMSTPTPMIRKSISRLQRAGGSLLGVVLNSLDIERSKGYQSGEYTTEEYGYNYGSDAYRIQARSSAQGTAGNNLERSA